ncbi:hypothetical protein IAT38_002152 [Cryptococcus sp. DSM 104549]
MNRTLRQLAPVLQRPTHTARALSSLGALRAPPRALAGGTRLGDLPLGRQALFVRMYATGPKEDGKEKESLGEKVYQEAQNQTAGAREELRNVTGDFAKIIAGSSPEAAKLGARELTSPKAHPGSITEDLGSVTSSIISEVPKPAMVFGALGTLPYLATSVSTIALARQASLASNPDTAGSLDLTSILEQLHTVEHIQVTYGAILLSFLGAIHWGMEFAQLGGTKGYARLALGVAPVLFAWPTTFLSHGMALATQWAGFTLMWVADQRASSEGWTTPWYSTYRFYLSIIVGFSIIGTLGGTGYYGAGAGAVTDAQGKHYRHTTERTNFVHRLEKVRDSNVPGGGKLSGKVGGDIAVEEDDSGEGYLKFRNIEKEDEKKREEDEEKKKKAEEQDKKEKEQKEKSPNGQKDDQKKRTEGESNTDQGKKSNDKSGDEKKDEPKKDEGKKEEPKDQGKKSEPAKSDVNDQEGKKKEAEEKKGAAGDDNAKLR